MSSKNIMLAVILILAVTLPSILATPPLSPPAISVITNLPAPSPCIGFTFGEALTFDASGNVYVASRCGTTAASTTVQVQIHKISPSGTMIWTATETCGGLAICGGPSIALDGAGRLLVIYNDPSIPVHEQVIKFYNPSTGAILTSNSTALVFQHGTPANFTLDFSRGEPPRQNGISWRICGAHCIDYYFGGSNYRLSMRCTGPSRDHCSKIWEASSAANGGDYINYDGGYTDKLYYTDTSSSVVNIINTSTGAVDSTAGLVANLVGAFAQKNTTRGFQFAWNGAAPGRPKLNELNVTSMATIRSDIGFTDGNIGNGNSLNHASLDGEGSGYLCGFANPVDAAASSALVMKTNTSSAPGVRWVSNLTGTGAAGQLVASRGCYISPQGNLYVIRTETVAGQSFPNQITSIIKFTADASARIPNPTGNFTADWLGIIPTPSPTGPNSDALTGLKNFANDTGFQSEGSQILWGFFLLIILTILAGAIGFRVAGRETALIAAGTTAFVISVINVVAEWWPVWVTVMFAVGIAAFVSYRSRKLFAGG